MFTLRDAPLAAPLPLPHLLVNQGAVGAGGCAVWGTDVALPLPKGLELPHGLEASTQVRRTYAYTQRTRSTRKRMHAERNVHSHARAPAAFFPAQHACLPAAAQPCVLCAGPAHVHNQARALMPAQVVDTAGLAALLGMPAPPAHLSPRARSHGAPVSAAAPGPSAAAARPGHLIPPASRLRVPLLPHAAEGVPPPGGAAPRAGAGAFAGAAGLAEGVAQSKRRQQPGAVAVLPGSPPASGAPPSVLAVAPSPTGDALGAASTQREGGGRGRGGAGQRRQLAPGGLGGARSMAAPGGTPRAAGGGGGGGAHSCVAGDEVASLYGSRLVLGSFAQAVKAGRRAVSALAPAGPLLPQQQQQQQQQLHAFSQAAPEGWAGGGGDEGGGRRAAAGQRQGKAGAAGLDEVHDGSGSSHRARRPAPPPLAQGPAPGPGPHLLPSPPPHPAPRRRAQSGPAHLSSACIADGLGLGQPVQGAAPGSPARFRRRAGWGVQVRARARGRRAQAV